MITKKKIDRLSDADLEKIYQYLSSLKRTRKTGLNIRSLKLGGKLDNRNIRTIAQK